MVVLFLGFDQHVVDIDFDVSTDLVVEYSVHQSLVGGSCVLQSKWHHFVAEESSACDEGCFLLVVLIHHYLVVS